MVALELSRPIWQCPDFMVNLIAYLQNIQKLFKFISL